MQFEEDYFMKSFYVASLTAIAVIAAAPFVSGMPVVANLQTAKTTIAQNVQRQAPVKMSLGAEKQILQKDAQGKQQVSWQLLQGKVTVQPGDVIRYTLKGENNSDRPVTNLVFSQPIPQGTVYILNSASVAQNAGAKITYSIDSGKTFAANPTIKVKLANGKVETRPAPAEAYTNIRWNFGSSISPEAKMTATYQVKVQ